jgi:hypothetical protein
LHEAIPFQTAQRLGEHFLRDSPNVALKFNVPFGAMRQDLDDESGPFVGDSVKHEPGWTLGVEDGTVRRNFRHELLYGNSSYAQARGLQAFGELHRGFA